MKTILWILPRNLCYCGKQIGRNAELGLSMKVANLMVPDGTQSVCCGIQPRELSVVSFPLGSGDRRLPRLNQVTLNLKGDVTSKIEVKYLLKFSPIFSYRKKLEQIFNFYFEVYHRVDMPYLT